MRLEVLADNKGAVIYVLNRPEIYIGSTENNDIVIPSPEISKKHLKLIITEDKKCFVIDQGSTNGSFMNDERLIPGRREEFKLFTSMRLGDQVLLTLLDKDKGDLPELPLREQFVEEKQVIAEEDKTRVISLKTLQKTKTEKVRKKRLKKLEKDLKKKKQKREDKATLNRGIFSALVVIALAFAAMKGWDLHKKRKARKTIVSQMKETQLMIDDRIESLEENVADFHIPEALLLPVADISKHADDLGCSLPEELFFCKRMPRGSRKKNSAINLNGQVVIYLEQKEWMMRAQQLVSTYSELGPVDAEAVSIETLNRIAFLSYIKTYLWRPLPKEIQDFNLYLVFYTHAGTELEIQNVMAIRGSLLGQVNARYSEDFFKFRKYEPYKIIRNLDRYYRVF